MFYFCSPVTSCSHLIFALRSWSIGSTPCCFYYFYTLFFFFPLFYRFRLFILYLLFTPSRLTLPPYIYFSYCLLLSFRYFRSWSTSSAPYPSPNCTAKLYWGEMWLLLFICLTFCFAKSWRPLFLGRIRWGKYNYSNV